MVGLACLAFLVRRQVLRAVSIGAAALLPVAAFGVISVANGSYFLPNPLMVKAVGENASMASALLKPFGSEDLAFLQNNRAMPILLGLSVLGALAHGLTRRGFWRPSVLFPLALAAMILLHGHFVFSPLFWVYRYDAYLVAFGIFVAAVVLVEMPSPGALPRGALPALLVASLVPMIADVREGLFPDAEIEGMRNTYLEQYQTAQFLRRYYPRDAVIVNDLGAVTYYTQARILDLVGLGDIEPLVIMRRTAYTSRDVVAWTARYEPKVAIVSLNWSVVAPADPPRVGQGGGRRRATESPSRRLLRRRPETESGPFAAASHSTSARWHGHSATASGSGLRSNWTPLPCAWPEPGRRLEPIHPSPPRSPSRRDGEFARHPDIAWRAGIPRQGPRGLPTSGKILDEAVVGVDPKEPRRGAVVLDDHLPSPGPEGAHHARAKAILDGCVSARVGGDRAGPGVDVVHPHDVEMPIFLLPGRCRRGGRARRSPAPAR